MGFDHKQGIAQLVSDLLVEYAAEGARRPRPLDPELSLREELGIDSLSLVSVMVRLGEAFGVYDLEAWGAELGKLRTVGDVIDFGRALGRTALSST